MIREGKFKDVVSHIEQVAARERAKTAGKGKNEVVTTKKTTLFLNWPDDVRGVPNAILRSALFSPIKYAKNEYLESSEIYAQGGIRIKYTGIRLNMYDLEIWETALHIAREQALGQACTSTAYRFLKLMGKPDTSAYRKILEASLTRMNATAIKIENNGYGYEGSMIMSVSKGDRGYLIQFDPTIFPLFSTGQCTHLNDLISKALSKKPIAAWLHRYYSSHAKPYPIKIQTFLSFTGCKNKNLASAKQNIKRGLAHLASAHKSNGQLFRYEIKNDLIYVKKQPSKSQLKHLQKVKKIP